MQAINRVTETIFVLTTLAKADTENAVSAAVAGLLVVVTGPA